MLQMHLEVGTNILYSQGTTYPTNEVACDWRELLKKKGLARQAALFAFPPRRLIGCIAQLVEHWAFNLMVAGSSPAIPKPT